MTEAGAFKHYYGVPLAQTLADKLRAVQPDFPAESFVAAVAAEIDPLELKARVALIARALREHLPPDYPQALNTLLATLGPELGDGDGMFNEGFDVLPIATFVEHYGLDHFDESLDALYAITKRFTSEFAVRPYLMRDPERALSRLRGWVDDPNPHVRRWVSEGTRTRLPWGARLHLFIRDPEPVIGLLEHLKADPSPYVRKSVANNLNDLVKDHPERILDLLESWKGDAHPDTDWIIRHALRTLVKAGHPRALALLGYGDQMDIDAAHFAVSPAQVTLGETLLLTLTLENRAAAPVDLVIDYRVHFVKANGSTRPKVFKWTTLQLAAGESVTLTKKLPLRPVTTRTYYAGAHPVDVQINGQVLASAVFALKLA